GKARGSCRGCGPRFAGASLAFLVRGGLGPNSPSLRERSDLCPPFSPLPSEARGLPRHDRRRSLATQAGALALTREPSTGQPVFSALSCLETPGASSTCFRPFGVTSSTPRSVMIVLTPPTPVSGSVPAFSRVCSSLPSFFLAV